MLNNLFVTTLARLADVRREEGQGMVEYGLILGLVSVLAIAALTLIGVDVQNTLTSVANAV